MVTLHVRATRQNQERIEQIATELGINPTFEAWDDEGAQEFEGLDIGQLTGDGLEFIARIPCVADGDVEDGGATGFVYLDGMLHEWPSDFDGRPILRLSVDTAFDAVKCLERFAPFDNWRAKWLAVNASIVADMAAAQAEAKTVQRYALGNDVTIRTAAHYRDIINEELGTVAADWNNETGAANVGRVNLEELSLSRLRFVASITTVDDDGLSHGAGMHYVCAGGAIHEWAADYDMAPLLRASFDPAFDARVMLERFAEFEEFRKWWLVVDGEIKSSMAQLAATQINEAMAAQVLADDCTAPGCERCAENTPAPLDRAAILAAGLMEVCGIAEDQWVDAPATINRMKVAARAAFDAAAASKAQKGQG